MDISNVMQREQLCSEHAAYCFIEAKRREKQNKRGGMMDEKDQEKLKKFMLDEGISSVDYLIRMNKALLKFARSQQNEMHWLEQTGFLD